MPKKGKKYLEASKLFDKRKTYSVQEATELIAKLSYSKFVGSVDIAIKTFANPKYNDQNVRATISLPHGNGKTVKVAVYTTDDKIADVKKAGADIAWSEDLLEKIEKWEINFDVLVTSPDLMRNLAKVAKILWPKGLMPNPKAGTVAADIVGAVWEIKKGRFEYRLDKTGNIHASIGKTDFSAKKLEENIVAFLDSVHANKPAGIKGKLIKRITLSPTMWPGITIDS